MSVVESTKITQRRRPFKPFEPLHEPDEVRPLHDITTDRMATELIVSSAQLDAATCRFLDLIYEFDRSQSWGELGATSCAHWLAWRCGLAIGTAREKVRVAHAMQALPLLHETFKKGHISYCKVRELSRIATRETEQKLVEVAISSSGSVVDKLVRQCARAIRNNDPAKARSLWENRSLQIHDDEDGSMTFILNVPNVQGEIIRKSLEARQNQLENDGVISNHSHQRVDSFISLLTGEVQSAQYEVIVKVDKDDAKIGNSSIFEESLRRILCDSPIRTVTLQGPELRLGRKTRRITAGLRKFLNNRDDGCIFPGCNRKQHIHAHHIQHWSDHGLTEPSNLVSLCSFHHELVHEGGWKVHRSDNGNWIFTSANGETVTHSTDKSKLNLRVRQLYDESTTYKDLPTIEETMLNSYAADMLVGYVLNSS